MSQLDKEMADILEACLNNPEYLNGTNWMCQMVMEYSRDHWEELIQQLRSQP